MSFELGMRTCARVQDNYRVNVYKVKRGSVNEYINSMIRRRRRENLRAQSEASMPPHLRLNVVL